MCPAAFCRHQRGDALIEALIGALLMLAIGLGLAYVASRQMVAQRYMDAQNVAVTAMRDLMQAQGLALCDTTPTITLPPSHVLTVKVTCSSGSVSVGGMSMTQDGNARSLSLSVTSIGLFGGSGTIVVGD